MRNRNVSTFIAAVICISVCDGASAGIRDCDKERGVECAKAKTEHETYVTAALNSIDQKCRVLPQEERVPCARKSNVEHSLKFAALEDAVKNACKCLKRPKRPYKREPDHFNKDLPGEEKPAE